MMNKKNQEDKKRIGVSFSDFLKKNASIMVIIIITFALAVVLSFLSVSMKSNGLSFDINEYEVGQISDRTVIAETAIESSGQTKIVIQKGDKIIRKGFAITDLDYQKLTLLADTPTEINFRAFANTTLYFILLFTLAIYLFSPGRLGRQMLKREMITLSTIFILVYATAAFCSKLPVFSTSYSITTILPGTLCVILITILFGERDAVYFSFILSLGVAAACSFDMIPMLYTMASCMASARIVRKIEKRLDLMFASLVIGFLNTVFLFAFQVIFNDTIQNPIFCFVGVILNGFFSGILALGLLTPLEYLLNSASVFRLMDLSDLNSPVMRKMLLSAPGTYNHSLMVANLAESACSEIGARPLLARVGAYYHDIGKMEQPEYFVENQNGDNKHDEINPRLSVSVIRRHVKKGVEKAHLMRLPQEVIDIIAEHHGNSLISFFYNEAKKIDDQVSPEEYSYIGTPPSSRESAVVMLADTVEAACRTLDKPSVSRLEKFIHQLLMAKYEGHQLDNSSLTFKDLDVIQNAFVTMLAGYYHSRIEYPNQKDPDETDTVEKASSNVEVAENQNHDENLNKKTE